MFTNYSQLPRPGRGALAPGAASCQLGYTVIVVLAVGKYPAGGRAGLPNSREVFAVVGVVTLDPTLQVVGAIGGENFASGEIVSKMFLHSMYLSFFCDNIIPHFCGFVNPFDELFTICSHLAPGRRPPSTSGNAERQVTLDLPTTFSFLRSLCRTELLPCHHSWNSLSTFR